MSVFADVALGAAPIAGGALFGVLAGTIKGPDFRALIKADMELLDKVPAEEVALRTAMRNNIDSRLYELIAVTDRNRQLREAASTYKGDWRDVVVFICAAMFALVWWNVPHSRTNWLITFIFLVALAALVGLYAARGVIRVARRPRNRHSAG
jgi:hypothetical protein